MTPEFTTFVETKFKTEFSAAYPAIPVLFSNVPVLDSVKTYVVLHVMSSDDTVPISIGLDSQSRNVGVIQIDVFTPKDKGAGSASRIAHFCCKIFKRKDFVIGSEGLAVFKDGSVQDRGEFRGRHDHLVRIPYRYDFKD